MDECCKLQEDNVEMAKHVQILVGQKSELNQLVHKLRKMDNNGHSIIDRYRSERDADKTSKR